MCKDLNYLLAIVENIHPFDFEPEDLKYDGGQYQYFIDNDFQPKQYPGMAHDLSLIRELVLFPSWSLSAF